jgi:predicted lipoprotein with Yx(FWY)xxD motif
MADEQTTARQSSSVGWVLFPVGIGLAVTAAVYFATQVITPDINTSLFGQRAADAIALKSWLASGVLALVAFQLYSALWIYGRMPWRKPGWLGRAHRASGYAAIVLSLPIAYHCLLAYGFRDLDRRTVVHSIAGCFFYGAFAAKVIVVRSRRLPGWALPVAGGTMVALVVVLWYSAALWYFNGSDSPGLGAGASVVGTAYPGYRSTAAGPARTPAVVSVGRTGLGAVLVDAQGRTLYLFDEDPPGQSACSAECAAVWPPLTTKGPPAAGQGAIQSELGTTRRSGGILQVTYHGHPLYLYIGDSGAGQTRGEGLSQFGAQWWTISAAGQKVTS